MIVRVNVVLSRTVVVGRDLRFDNLCSSCDNYEDLCSSHGSVTLCTKKILVVDARGF